jgi:hypothetical protein
MLLLLLLLSMFISYFLRVLRFSSLRKNQHSKFQFDLGVHVHVIMSRALTKEFSTLLSVTWVNIILFFYFYFFIAIFNHVISFLLLITLVFFGN